MKFNKHGSFYVRYSWPMKGVKAIQKNNTIFSPQNELEALDELGVGRVMVTSIRYWLGVMGLVYETKDKNGLIKHEFTEEGTIIADYDGYFQSPGTMWLLHYNIATNKENATSWYWFFNEFNKGVFAKEQAIDDLKLYVLHNGIEIADSSINRDINCLMQMYMHNSTNKDSFMFAVEEGITSFFSGTGLVKQEDRILYKKNKPGDYAIPPEIVYYCILKQEKQVANRQISIEQIYEEFNSVGKIFSLSFPHLLKYLQRLEDRGYLKIFNRFGHNHIEIIEEDKAEILKQYYRKVMQ